MSTVLQGFLNHKSVISALRYFEQFNRQLSHNTALVTKIHRKIFVRQYPVTVVQPDGSSYTIRYQEPRVLIKLPLDISTLSPEEVQKRLQRRKPKQKVVINKEESDNYQSSKYVNLMRKKKK